MACFISDSKITLQSFLTIAYLLLASVTLLLLTASPFALVSFLVQNGQACSHATVFAPALPSA